MEIGSKLIDLLLLLETAGRLVSRMEYGSLSAFPPLFYPKQLQLLFISESILRDPSLKDALKNKDS